MDKNKSHSYLQSDLNVVDYLTTRDVLKIINILGNIQIECKKSINKC